MGTAGKIDYVVVRQPSYLNNFAKLIDETLSLSGRPISEVALAERLRTAV